MLGPREPAGRGRRPTRAGEGGRARGVRGEGRPAGQHESAAAGAEAAQPARGPGGGDGAPPLPRPHQRGGPAGKPRGRPVSQRRGRGAGWGFPGPRGGRTGRRLGRALLEVARGCSSVSPALALPIASSEADRLFA